MKAEPGPAVLRLVRLAQPMASKSFVMLIEDPSVIHFCIVRCMLRASARGGGSWHAHWLL